MHLTLYSKPLKTYVGIYLNIVSFKSVSNYVFRQVVPSLCPERSQIVSLISIRIEIYIVEGI